MKRLLCSFVLLSLIAGCTAPQSTSADNIDTAKQPKPATAEENKPATAPAKPPVAQTALEYLGYPFKKAMHYKLENMGATYEGGREFVVNNAGDKVTIDIKWTGEIGSLLTGGEQYVATSEGIKTTMAQGSPIEPPPLYMPADPVPGKSWSADYRLQLSNLGDVSVKTVFRILGEETVKVPLGTFKGLVLLEKGTLTGKDIVLTMEGKSWFVKGVGMVKVEHNVTRKPSGGQKVESKLSFVAIPAPKE